MRKKKIITSIVVVICVLVGIFFIMSFGVLGRIYDYIYKHVVENKVEAEKEEGPEELKYETWHDEEGNEFVVEMRKIIVKDEEGNEVEIWEDTAEGKTIYSNTYLGRIEKIEDNKIYFMVDKEREFKGIGSKVGKLTVKDVKDYQVIFDIDTYDLESDPHVDYSVCDYLWFEDERFYNADELEFLIGKYLRVHEVMSEDKHTDEKYKSLYFQPESFIKSLFSQIFF